MKTPEITPELVEYLQKTFPDKLPETPTTLENVGILIGQQKVIRHLQAQLRVQSKAGMPNVT